MYNNIPKFLTDLNIWMCYDDRDKPSYKKLSDKVINQKKKTARDLTGKIVGKNHKTYSFNECLESIKNGFNSGIGIVLKNGLTCIDYDIIDSELIFCNHETKKPLSDVTLRKNFYHYIELAGVSKIRMYDLRHTYVATMMLEDKELYHISQRIGHSSYATTVDKYGHLSNKKRKEIAKVTDKYI